jgi:MFS family permease
MAHFSVGVSYLLDAASFLVFAVNLLRVSVSGLSPSEERAKLELSALVDGLRFVFKHPLIRSSMLLDFVATFFASATALLPLYVQDVLHAGAGGYGALSAAIAVGAVVTGVFAATRIERSKARGRLLLASVFAYGVFTCAFAYSQWFVLSFVCLVLVGAADTVSTIVRQLIRQLETPSRLRGRMQGVNLLFFMGGPQLGEWEAGLAAHHLGLKLSVFLGGAACAASALGFTLISPAVRSYTRPSEEKRPASEAQ